MTAPEDVVTEALGDLLRGEAGDNVVDALVHIADALDSIARSLDKLELVASAIGYLANVESHRPDAGNLE